MPHLLRIACSDRSLSGVSSLVVVPVGVSGGSARDRPGHHAVLVVRRPGEAWVKGVSGGVQGGAQGNPRRVAHARSVRPADALTRPLAPGGALRLAVRSPLIPFVDPLPLPGGCRHRSTGAGWWLTSARRSTSSVASTLLLLRRIVLVLCPGCAREPMPRRHCVGGL